MAGAEENSLRGVRSWPQPGDPREALFEAVLALVGERGFGEASLRELCERAGVGNRAFHRHFDSLEHCFEEAYEPALRGLAEEILAAGREGDDWQAGLRAALGVFLDFLASEPTRARALLLEYRGAGERAGAAHEEVCALLARALDTARLAPGALSDPPPGSARAALGGIEFIAIERLIGEQTESAPALAGTLSHFVVRMFFGEAAARAELG